MSEYINEFGEVCLAGSNDTRTRRPATELEIEQSEKIKELYEEIDWWRENGVDVEDFDKLRDAIRDAVNRLYTKNQLIKRLLETKFYFNQDFYCDLKTEIFNSEIYKELQELIKQHET